MPDITNRVILIFKHPKCDQDEQPTMVGVPIPWFITNGPPITQKGKPWIHMSTEIIQ